MLVIDANIAVHACGRADGFQAIGVGNGERLAAPPLLWSEARATLCMKHWTGEISNERATTMLDRLEAAPVERRDPPKLGRRAWEIAKQLGWARTYDAEFVALADMLGCRLLTVDGRLRRGADRLGFVITPDELKPAADA